MVIQKAIRGETIPVYGDGRNVRDWLFVEDHCEGICRVLRAGDPGDTYNFGGDCEMANIDLVHMICDILDELRPLGGGWSRSRSGGEMESGRIRGVESAHHPSPITSYRDLITFVTDRPGHDRRYAIDFSRAVERLGWKPVRSISEGLHATVRWYLDNRSWVKTVLQDEGRSTS